METPIATEPRRERQNLDDKAAQPWRQTTENASSSPSDPEVLRRLYANMLTCRLVRERARGLMSRGEPAGGATWSEMSEAIEVGATFELRDGDVLSVYPRDLVTHILRGRSLQQTFAELLNAGRARKADREANPFLTFNVLPAASSLVAQFNLAAGVAFAAKQRSQRNVVLGIFADGFDALGSWHEAAKLAGEHRLPLIFLVESDRCRDERSNHWFGKPGDLSQRAHEYGFPGIPVDGDDVVAVFRVTQESIHRARNGAGPTLIECKSSRAGNPSTSSGTRRKTAAITDPLAHMEHYLKKRKAWSQAWKEELAHRIKADSDAAVAAVKPSRGQT